MPETLDSNMIRHLILKFKRERGQISDIVQAVLQLAVKEGALSSVPNIQYENPLADKITAVIWELIIEGLYTPGAGMQTPNLPFLRATEYGLQCFVAGELTAHDPDDYLMKLKAACPTIDEITLLYAAEALGTFRAAKYLATSVMIGVATESMLVRLVKSTSRDIPRASEWSGVKLMRCWPYFQPTAKPFTS